MANIYQNKKTKRFYIKNYINGTNHTITRDANGNFFLTKKEALNFIYSNVDQLKQQSTYGVKKCSYFYKIYLANLERNSKMSHYEAEQYLFNSQIAPFFEKIALSRLDNQKLIDFSKTINDKNASYRYKSRILTRTKEFLEFIQVYMPNKIELSYLRVDPNTFKNNRILSYYSVEEFKTFYNALDSPFYKFMFLLLFNYGLRIGELRALQVKDIDIKDNILNIDKQANSKNQKHKTILCPTKTTSSIRTYPLNKGITDLFKEMNKYKYPNSFIFTLAKKSYQSKDPNHIISETQIRRVNNSTAIKAHLPHIRIHDFRHSCAIYLIKNGIDFTRIASWLGHSSPATTANYYLRYSDKNKEEISNLIQNTVNDEMN